MVNGSRLKTRLKRSLLISDIDGTVVDMWDAWGQATRRAVSRLAYTRKMPIAEIEKILATTSSEKNISIVDDLGFVIAESPLAGVDSLDYARAEKVTSAIGLPPEEVDSFILERWWYDRDRYSVLHKGVEPTLWTARHQGAKIVLYTDSPCTLVLHRLWVSHFHLDLVDAIYCRADPKGMKLKGLKKPMPDSDEARFKQILHGRFVEFDSSVKKPSHPCMKQILDDFNTQPEQALMIGDHAVDVASARLFDGMAAIWDVDGARVSPATIAQYLRLSQWAHYAIGEEAIRKRMAELEVTPDITLDRRFDQLTDYIEFISSSK